MGELQNHLAFLKYGSALLLMLLGCVLVAVIGMGFFMLGNSIAGLPGAIFFGAIAVLLTALLGRRISA